MGMKNCGKGNGALDSGNSKGGVSGLAGSLICRLSMLLSSSIIECCRVGRNSSMYTSSGAISGTWAGNCYFITGYAVIL